MEADDTMRWFDPASDPAYRQILAAAVRAARRDRPDVLTTPQLLPQGFAEIVFLTVERAQNLRIAALQAAAPYVEQAVAHAQFLRAGASPDPGRGIPELLTSRMSRARAALYLAQEKVVTAHELHHANLEGLRRYGLRALADLDQAIKANHRFGQHLTYLVPTEIQFPDDIDEIGLARVRAALNDPDQNDENNEPKEGVA